MSVRTGAVVQCEDAAECAVGEQRLLQRRLARYSYHELGLQKASSAAPTAMAQQTGTVSAPARTQLSEEGV